MAMKGGGSGTSGTFCRFPQYVRARYTGETEKCAGCAGCVRKDGNSHTPILFMADPVGRDLEL